MTDAILKMENITKSFGDGDTTVQVLKDISFSVKRGEFVAVVGPSGSGKSTLLSIIGALLTPSTGKVTIDEEMISEYKSSRLTSVRLEKIGFIFQSANLIPYLSVRDQLLLVGDIAGGGRNKKSAVEMLEQLGLGSRLKNYPKELSGGEKQRVAIARAFMNDPELILADEPTASLDSDRGKQVVEMIAREVKSRNKAALMVTHDERVLHLCDRVLYIEDGRIMER
ncbi:ABC transporter ATP-binding protein [Bacillus salacetis]|uniref:ABC transporter ATP-binding protein n=1 Tax=Bacillus salacetis TaxID=2315464 RepID=A0A3A1QQ45_9BACI|nr:ABC transporter ATP-binding protein [Bacillus salacetis]RIW29205.1 ABC transporter ATP-binding protein [Bacillus salacetis]